MKPRAYQGKKPQILFTSDFHELVQGELDFSDGDCMCALRYDPLRLMEADAAEDHEHQVTCYVRFHPSGQEWYGLMTVPPTAPLKQLADPTGQGFMLETEFPVPPGTEELEVWFSCAHEDGTTHWDSEFGTNHWLRFPTRDIEIDLAAVKKAEGNQSPAMDYLEFKITATQKVEKVSIRWRLTNMPGSGRNISSLEQTEETGGGGTWCLPEGNIPVPVDGTVAFDIVYQVAGREYTDDNQGNWYLAD